MAGIAQIVLIVPKLDHGERRAARVLTERGGGLLVSIQPKRNGRPVFSPELIVDDQKPRNLRAVTEFYWDPCINGAQQEPLNGFAPRPRASRVGEVVQDRVPFEFERLISAEAIHRRTVGLEWIL